MIWITGKTIGEEGGRKSSQRQRGNRLDEITSALARSLLTGLILVVAGTRYLLDAIR